MEQAKSTSQGDTSTHCLYPSKRCDNPRVMKANGQLHNFCQFHRDKANYNQRQLEFKRKARQEQRQPSTAQTAPIPTTGPRLLPKPPTSTAKPDGSESEFEVDEDDIRLIEEVASANVENQ